MNSSTLYYKKPAKYWTEALPEAWSAGSVKGLRVRGNALVDITWRGGKVTDYKLHGSTHKKIIL